MACYQRIHWLIALGVALTAIVASFVTYNSSCTNSKFLLCKVRQLIGFCYLQWRWRRLFPLTVKQLWGCSESGFSHGLLWMAPFLSGGGYCSEALAYMLGLVESRLVPNLGIDQHGDLANEEFWKGLPSSTKTILIKAYNSRYPLNATVVICHSEPGAWYPPLFETNPCPPTGYDEPFYVIGRTMFETDRLNADHVKRCNQMDEIWVPSEFNMETFARSGVDPSKLLKVVQPVDVWFFDPMKVKPLPLPANRRLFGPKLPKHVNFLPESSFIFLSIFKWEKRKGWDLLIKAYMKEFSAKDNVVLFLFTNEYHTEINYKKFILDYVKSTELHEPEQGWPALHVTDEHVPQVDLPRVYKSANAFVLPSRGEGWGRPHVEAMSMRLPVIATNWSGMLEYMTVANSYPLPVDRLVEVQEGAFKGHLWAEPAVQSLQSLMRHVFTNPIEAKEKGILARQTMMARFSPEVVTKEIVAHLIRIEKKRQAV